MAQLPLTDAGLKEIGKLDKLTKLIHNGCPITDAGVAELDQLENPTMLGISGTRITDATIKDLIKYAKHRNMTNISISGTQVTPAAKLERQFARSKLEITK